MTDWDHPIKVQRNGSNLVGGCSLEDKMMNMKVNNDDNVVVVS